MNKTAQKLADSKDIWLRHLLFESEISNGEVSPQFFENAFKKPRTEKVLPWALEISGRLLSMTLNPEQQISNVEAIAMQTANELQQKAEERQLPSNHPWRTARFLGVIYQTVEIIRTIELNLYDVVPDPSKKDAAHANLVRFTEFPQIKKGKVSPLALAKLMESFRVVKAGSPELRTLLQQKI